MPYQYKREPLSDKETGHLAWSPIKKNILITGLPGVGKTTLIKKLSEELKHLHPAGFYTAEIREEGVRKGFELISLDGRRGLLSHKEINPAPSNGILNPAGRFSLTIYPHSRAAGYSGRCWIKSPHKVGQYRVDIKGFEDLLNSIPFFNPSTRLIIIDEIGKMECLSDQFKKLLKEILDSEKWVIATIALKGGGLIAEVKEREDVRLFEMTRSNRDIIFSEILNLTSEILNRQK